jgi:hypothetical protein
MFKEKTCERCGIQFTPTTGRQRFCGNARIKGSCSWLWKKELGVRRGKLDSTKKYRTKWYKENKERIAALSKIRYDENKESILARNKKTQRPYLLRKLYGITPAVYDEMLRAQDCCCAICRSKTYGRNARQKYFAVDHCHVTGKVRGLLCMSCNQLLGKFERYRDHVMEYLKKAESK